MNSNIINNIVSRPHSINERRDITLTDQTVRQTYRGDQNQDEDKEDKSYEIDQFAGTGGIDTQV